MRRWRSALSLSALIAWLAASVAAWQAPAAPPSCEIEGAERIVAVGDVHGAYDRYVEILKTAGVINDDRRWIGQKTHLVQLGDVVDRGPDSRKVLDLIRRLEDDAKKGGGQVHYLLGNHEVMRMLSDMRYVTPGEYAAFTTPQSEDVRSAVLQNFKPEEREQVLKELPLGSVEMRRAFSRSSDEYGAWLRTHDVTVRINGTVFLHGGISPAVAPLGCDEINRTVRREVTEDLEKTLAAPLTSLAAREDGPLWYRGLALEPESFAPQLDAILAAQHARAIVVAHTVIQTGRVDVRFGGKVIVMDTGMQPAYMPNGRASALEIVGNTRTVIYTDRRDVLPPLTASQ